MTNCDQVHGVRPMRRSIRIEEIPPGPKRRPWLGNLGELRQSPMAFYTRISQEYGGLVRFWYGRKPTYLVSTPELIKELLVDQRRSYVKNKRYKALRGLIGDGLLLSEGELWRRQRMATMPGFSGIAIAHSVPRMVDVIDEHLERWETLASTGEPVDLECELSVISQALIGEWILGANHAGIVRRLIASQRRLAHYWPTPPGTLLGSFRLPMPRTIFGLKRALAAIDDCFFEAIRRERQAPTQSASVLSILCSHRKEGGRFNDQQVRDQLVTLYMAGFETSAAAAAWLFYRLSLQPEIRKQLSDEVMEVLEQERPTMGSLADLDLTKRAIQETLRLYPPAYNFSRVAVEDHLLGGYRIPAGSMVIVSPWATHRLCSHWENPEGFDPGRFLPEASAARPAFAYIPFGGGHRACIGTRLAMVQITLVTARILQRYNLDLAPAHRVEAAPGTVLRPRCGMRMFIQRFRSARIEPPSRCHTDPVCLRTGLLPRSEESADISGSSATEPGVRCDHRRAVTRAE